VGTVRERERELCQWVQLERERSLLVGAVREREVCYWVQLEREGERSVLLGTVREREKCVSGYS